MWGDVTCIVVLSNFLVFCVLCTTIPISAIVLCIFMPYETNVSPAPEPDTNTSQTMECNREMSTGSTTYDFVAPRTLIRIHRHSSHLNVQRRSIAQCTFNNWTMRKNALYFVLFRSIWTRSRFDHLCDYYSIRNFSDSENDKMYKSFSLRLVCSSKVAQQ